jgi:hypothetical protein
VEKAKDLGFRSNEQVLHESAILLQLGREGEARELAVRGIEGATALHTLELDLFMRLLWIDAQAGTPGPFRETMDALTRILPAEPAARLSVAIELGKLANELFQLKTVFALQCAELAERCCPSESEFARFASRCREAVVPTEGGPSGGSSGHSESFLSSVLEALVDQPAVLKVVAILLLMTTFGGIAFITHFEISTRAAAAKGGSAAHAPTAGEEKASSEAPAPPPAAEAQPKGPEASLPAAEAPPKLPEASPEAPESPPPAPAEAKVGRRSTQMDFPEPPAEGVSAGLYEAGGSGL